VRPPVEKSPGRCLALSLTIIVFLIAACPTNPSVQSAAQAPTEIPGRVSYERDATDPIELPRLSATIVSAEVGRIMDWDAAHDQFLAELSYSGIFSSVELEPQALVDYGAGFSLSELPGRAMQVQVTFVNMHTGETVFSGVARGNRRNGNFGFAYIEGTDTTSGDALRLQSALAEAISSHRVKETDVSSRSIAVLQPIVDRSGVPERDKDLFGAFNDVVDGGLRKVIEQYLVQLTGARVMDSGQVDRTVSGSGHPAGEPSDLAATADIGRLLGVDYVVASTIGYDEDEYVVVNLEMVETSTGALFRSAIFQANVWSEREVHLAIGTQIDRMFHSVASGSAPSGRAASGNVPSEPAGASADAGTAVSLTVQPIYPVFHSYYDDHPVGVIRITNEHDTALENLSVSFFVDQYMENPKSSQRVVPLEPGETAEVPIFGLFTSGIMEITEDTRLSARVNVTYTLHGEPVSEALVQSVDVLNRNALTWDDDEKAAAFVTARDPAVMSFARRVSGIVRQTDHQGVDDNLALAIGFHEALDTYGVEYVTDPASAYAELSTRQSAVDYLLFPRQTLEYHGGDCDDLTVLYCALLEAVGIESAFITVPGHIFAAVSLGETSAPERRASAYSGETIHAGGREWLPVEVTLRGSGFRAAWEEGAREWREGSERNEAAIYPVRDAWQHYPPVALPGSSAVDSLDPQMVNESISTGLDDFVDAQMAALQPAIVERMAREPQSPRWPNRLGILYGRYGFDDQAVEWFGKALDLDGSYVPALLNLGNVSLLVGQSREALAYYQQALELSPDDPEALLAVARAQHELGNYDASVEIYSRLLQVAPRVAGNYDYLKTPANGSTRAARAGATNPTVLWSDEPGAE